MNDNKKRHHPIRRQRKTQEPEVPDPGASPELVEEPPRRERRALSHVGGDVEFAAGSDAERSGLAKALDVSSAEDEVMMDVHGFHSYPARLHPLTARRLIEEFSAPGATVLDPFCGSGTVVVEARALGRSARGSDLNPLAVELSWLKSRAPGEKQRSELLSAAARIAEVAEERRLAKADPYVRYDSDDRDRYPIHILLELDSLAHGISLVRTSEVERSLRLVVSSILTKVAHSEGDTTRRRSPRRLPAGFAIELFLNKTEELVRRLAAYHSRLAKRAPRAYVDCCDARQMAKVESDSVDLIITSPPYPGVYDYLDHHLHRISWLGLRAGGLQAGEIGARREYRRLSLHEAARKWQDELGATLWESRRALTPEGRGIVVIADSVVDRRPLRADEQVRSIADRAGIDVTCIASQPRPLFLHGADQAFTSRPRMEHVVVFRPKDRSARRPRLDRKTEAELQQLRDRPRPERFQRPSPQRTSDDRPRGHFGDRPRDDRPRGHFGERGRYDNRGRDDRPRGHFGERPRDDNRGRAHGERDRSAAYGRDNQANTWGSKPEGAARPSWKSSRKPR